MKKVLLVTLAVLSSAFTTFAAGPSIASPGVYNAASYALAAFPNGGIARGSIFVVFGSGLGPSAISYNSSLPLSTSLSGTSVNVTVNGATEACPMFYTSTGQIAAILPSTTPVGKGTITVTYNGITSPTAPVTVVTNALGLFARNQQGTGPAVIQDLNSNYNSITNSFQPNQTVTFWGTGLGPITGSDTTTPPSGNLPGATVVANIGGQNAAVQYAGRSGYAGEDQINVTIPSGVTGCYVPVYMTVNGVPSNFVSISVTNSGAVCSDASLYTSTDLQNIANGGTLRTGGVLLEEFNLAIPISVPGLTIPPIEEETGQSAFARYDANTFLNSQGGLNTLAVSSGCTVVQYSGSSYTDPVLPTFIDAGSVINVTGPNGTRQMTKTGTGQYSATFVTPSVNPLAPPPAKFLTPGSYTVDNGAGGTAVGAFKVNVTVPNPVTWTNMSSVTTVPRNQPLTINWTGGGAGGQVNVIGISPLAVDTATFSPIGAGEFICVAPASTGTLTVPAAILSALPPSTTVSEDGFTLGGGFVIVNSISSTPATVPGLDVFLSGTSSGQGKIGVTFQ